MTTTGTADLSARLEELNDIGVSLSKEKDLARLLEKILLAAKKITNADAGTLYRVTDDGLCRFEIVRTDSLGLAWGGTTGVAIPFAPIRLTDATGRPNDAMVVAYAVLHDCTVAIADAYDTDRFDFSGTKAFDATTGYRSQSFLTVPLKDHEDQIIGVLQLINAQDRATGAIVPFSDSDRRLAESLASQAAIALTNRILIQQLEELFESFIALINIAIDDKSPYTGGHCQRVPVLTMMLAEAAMRTRSGPFAEFTLDDRELRELKLAGLLHDCGKVTTPVHVVDKATKLQTIHDRIELVDARFAVLRQAAELEVARGRLAADEGARVMASLAEERAFLRRCNLGGEAMSDADLARIHELATRTWTDADGVRQPLLTADEVANLTVTRGTLTAADREVIQNHAAMTHKMLAALPWPKQLRDVPEIAASHHERLDGKGYPRGLRAPSMGTRARILAIADVFEALTAKDRPYKPGKTLSESLRILGRMALEGAIDPALFEVFVRERVYVEYARRFLEPGQIDAVDEESVLAGVLTRTK